MSGTLKNQIKKINFPVVILLLFLVTLAVLTGIFDLEISKQIVNQNSGWAKFLENYGMIPGLIVIFSGIYIHYSYIKGKSDLRSNIKKVIFFLANTGLLLYLFYIILSSLIDKIFLDSYFQVFSIAFLIFSIAISTETFIILHIIKPVRNPLIIKYSNVVLGLAIFGYVICIQSVKWFWGRVRFRELDAAFSQFTPWYLPQGITGYDSFPSGHAAMGWILLALLVLFTNKKPWTKYLAFTLIFLYAVILALSRVIMGAHYASDVLFGSAAMILGYLYFSRKGRII